MDTHTHTHTHGLALEPCPLYPMAMTGASTRRELKHPSLPAALLAQQHALPTTACQEGSNSTNTTTSTQQGQQHQHEASWYRLWPSYGRTEGTTAIREGDATG